MPQRFAVLSSNLTEADHCRWLHAVLLAIAIILTLFWPAQFGRKCKWLRPRRQPHERKMSHNFRRE